MNSRDIKIIVVQSYIKKSIANVVYEEKGLKNNTTDLRADRGIHSFNTHIRDKPVYQLGHWPHIVLDIASFAVTTTRVCTGFLLQYCKSTITLQDGIANNSTRPCFLMSIAALVFLSENLCMRQ